MPLRLRFAPVRAALGAVIAVLVALPAVAHDGKLSFAPVLRNAKPAVVNISVTGERVQQRNPLFDDPFFRRFFDERRLPRSVPTQSAGSGVIIDARAGHVVTNHHVVANAKEIVVTLQDQRELNAELIGSDPGTDIALLKIDNANLDALPLGASRDVEVGDLVVAIGNPFGLGQTATLGIVSALGRTGLIPQGYEDFIQTDASINPGNSGGALVDLEGRLIGINTAIIAPAGGNVGIGFAVPSDIVQSVVAQLLEHGEVQRGWLGVSIQDVTSDLAEALDLGDVRGAVIAQVEEGSPAAAAGLEAGDVVVKLGDFEITSAADLRTRVGLMPAGERVELRIVRNGRELTRRVNIGTRAATSLRGEESSDKLAGAEFRNLSGDHPLYGTVEGVEVVGVQPGSPAAQYGLRNGDVVLSVNRRPVTTAEDLRRELASVDGAIALHVQRGRTRLFIVVQ